ncbi:MAG TPA: AAA family ATPase [Chthoniobacteraceae bacterium]|jgi:replication-associated recombination protein RarA
MLPTEFRPTRFADLIGPAGTVGRVIAAKVARLKAAPGNASYKAVFYGPPGTGKTQLAQITALALSDDRLAIEEISGLQVNIEVVKQWIHGSGMGGLFGDWQIKVVHEMDRIPPAAQDLLLQYLDLLPAKCGFIGTSNLAIDALQERFQTRLQTWKILGPTSDEIAGLLRTRWPVDAATANTIGCGCGGNVRAALLDLESHLDVQLSLAA